MDTDTEIANETSWDVAYQAVEMGAVDKREEEEKVYKVFFSYLIKARSPEHGMVRLQEMLEDIKENKEEGEEPTVDFKFREVDLDENQGMEIIFQGIK
tara:strand:+ start:73 stop:366 length:294 start_codon:yes stop_codon:yes gene_type:complete